MSCTIEIDKHCIVAWIPFNNSFTTPDTYPPRGKWSGLLFQFGHYKNFETGDTPGYESLKVLDSSGNDQPIPANWDWINIVSTDLLGSLGEPMERSHYDLISGAIHKFHQHFTPDEKPARVITFWQGALGYTVTSVPDAWGVSRFKFDLKYPVRVDVYAEGEMKANPILAAGSVASLVLTGAANQTLTHHTQQEPPG